MTLPIPYIHAIEFAVSEANNPESFADSLISHLYRVLTSDEQERFYEAMKRRLREVQPDHTPYEADPLYASLQARVKELESDLETSQDENSDLQNSLDDRDSRISELEGEQENADSDARRDLRYCQDQLLEANERIGELEAELSER